MVLTASVTAIIVKADSWKTEENDMAHLSYNGVCENRSFDQWCADNGVEVVTAWDAGMYGNITYKVRIAGKLLIASAYQSQHGNFTFDVSWMFD